MWVLVRAVVHWNLSFYIQCRFEESSGRQVFLEYYLYYYLID